MKPRPAETAGRPTLEELRARMHRAEYAAVARALEAWPVAQLSRDHALLHARVELRRRNPAAALELLARNAARMTTPAARAESALLSATAFVRLGDERSAAAHFKRAADLIGKDDPLRFELRYQRAAAAWIARKLEAAEKLVAELEDDTPEDVRLETAILRGAIASSRERLAEQGAILLDALRRVHAMDDPPALLWAAIVAQIAYLAREMPSAALREAAFSEIGAVPWTPDLAEYRFTALRAVGWRHALDGDYFNAFRRLKEASAVAPSNAWRVLSSSDRAYLATVLGERRWAEQELSDAHELAAAIPWATLQGEERFALPVLAELTAPHDPALALAYVARYKEIGSRFARNLASSDDRRVNALEAYSFGIVQLALGDRDEAARLLSEAWTIYDRIGYDWRAGRAATALAGVTGDPVWTERANAKLGPYRRSWLRTGAPTTRAAEPAEVAALTNAQRAVYDLLLRGLSTAAIAAAQGRSEFTVRNHIKVIFKTFGVSSRPALIARAVGTANG